MTRTITLIALAALLLGATALAQGGRFAGRTAYGAHLQTQATVGMGPAGQGSPVAARLQGVVASVLGLTQDELHALMLDGATIADVAAERGITIESLEATFVAARAEAVDQLVVEGALSAAQATLLKARSADAFADLIAREGAVQGLNVDGTPRYEHRATMGARAAAPRGAGFAATPGAHGGMHGMPAQQSAGRFGASTLAHTPRGAGRFGASAPTPAPRGAGRFGASAPTPALRGIGAGQAGPGPSGAVAERVEGVVAATLGLTQDELHALKLDGATIAEVAAERGTPVEVLESAYLAARAEAIQELLAEGAISELQAERMTARGPDAFAELLDRDAAEQGRNADGTPRFAHRSATTPGPQAAGMTPRGAGMTPRGGRW
jgi:hypothetical protein